MENDKNFKFVTYKRKKQNPKLPLINKEATNAIDLNPDQLAAKLARCCQRIEEAKAEIIQSDLYKSFSASLKEGLNILGNPPINEIVCLGLGKINECMISKYQFAFLLCLKDLYLVNVKVSDPIFNKIDKLIIEKFNCVVIPENLEGKYKIKDNLTTIFYLPHCPRQLTNNLLWANWGKNLNYCIIISNSFTYLIENTVKRILQKNAEFIENITPYIVELAVINNFKFFEIFNDTSIHIFPWEKIKLLSEDFWSLLSEPQYLEEDLEFITKN